ncbi:MAG TPA: hypothetical protein VMU59_14175 [Caulobacteraceae bacterium]|nr:hypothetical protein [Caulobacteraceae bacterium]
MTWALILTHWRAAAMALLTSLLALALWLWRAEAGHAARLQAELEAAKGAAAMANADAKASQAAGTVIAAGAARDAAGEARHEENDHAIQTAPGSGQGLDPGLNSAGRRGLCLYGAYRGDPACVQLLGPDPAGLSDAGAADPAAGG